MSCHEGLDLKLDVFLRTEVFLVVPGHHQPSQHIAQKTKRKRAFDGPFPSRLVIHKLVFYGLHGLYAIACQFGHVPDAISTFQQRYDFPILFLPLLGGLYAAFPSPKLAAAVDVLLPTAVETILDV